VPDLALEQAPADVAVFRNFAFDPAAEAADSRH
jgi:hypothetical protein